MAGNIGKAVKGVIKKTVAALALLASLVIS
jgi:hypothetical protein